MLLAAIIIILVAAIAYYHYVQGFLSSLISAICAVLAAVVAVGLHETLESHISRGRFSDEATSAALIVLFAAVYLVLRLIFDSVVPGNIRVAVWLERGGAAVLGLIAGIFATGVAAIAAQAMPFGPSIAYYSRYALESHDEVIIPMVGQQAVDSTTTNELVGDTFLPENHQSLLLPVDDLVMGLVARLSDGGSLSGERTLRSVHPNYLDELFGQRLGVQVGAKHTATNRDEDNQVRVIGVYDEQRPLPQADGNYGSVRPLKVDPILSPGSKQIALVVRIVFNQNAADKDHLVRFSCGSIHLVAKGKDYYPVGTLEGGNGVYRNKPDDFLFIDTKDSDAGADMLFIVDKADLQVDPAKPVKVGAELPQGVYISVKRLANIDLSGMKLASGAELTNTTGAGWAIQLMRRVNIARPGEAKPTKKK
jgi:hypothetical protein